MRPKKYKKVYGVDINKEYLEVVAERYHNLADVLTCLQIDLICDYQKLPKTQLVIANLLIEYIGYKSFQKVISHVEAKYVSCVIQINTDEKNWVSDSPYLHAFDRLDEVHCQMEENQLEQSMKEIAYTKIHQSTEALPNGKALLRMDFEKA